MRTKKQFTEFRRAFKKWRAHWAPHTTHYSIEGDRLILWFLEKDNKRYYNLTEYAAPGYGKYMAYQFRKFKKIK